MNGYQVKLIVVHGCICVNIFNLISGFKHGIMKGQLSFVIFSVLYKVLVVAGKEELAADIVLNCRNGYAHSKLYPDLVQFECKPGPARAEEVCCTTVGQIEFEIYYNNTPNYFKFFEALPGVPNKEWVCPNFGYISGLSVSIPDVYAATCCTAQGLNYSKQDCIEDENTDTENGRTYSVDQGKVFVGTWTLNGGRTWQNLKCRYRKYTNPNFQNYFYPGLLAVDKD